MAERESKSVIYLFVGCLPFSRYSYVEPAPDMKQDTWLRCHVRMFEFFGGSTPCIVPDNLKTGVTRHPREGEVVLNDAYRRRMRAHYIRVPDLEELWSQSRDRSGGESKLVRKYGNFAVLVLDEWLLDKPSVEFRSMLLELMERRYDTHSTIFCTQFKKKDWHSRLGGGVHADAIMDRIVHNAVWVGAGEVNMREKMGEAMRQG